MNMKILDPGLMDNPWEGAIMVCSIKDCHAKFLVEETDVRTSYDSEDSVFTYWYECPCCHTQGMLKGELIPLGARRRMCLKAKIAVVPRI